MRKMMLAAISATMVGGPAQAASFYDLSYSGIGTTVTARLTLDDTNPNRPILVGISGFRNGLAITGVVPINQFAGNDNVLFTQQPFATYYGGAAFSTSLGNFSIYNSQGVESTASILYECQAANCLPNRSSVRLTTFSLTSVPTPAVPEPATWAMMVGGFGVIGVAMRRRKVAVSFA